MSSHGFALSPAKRVLVYRNGDPFCPGRKFVVTQRRFPTLEVFLSEVTKRIRAPLAVRNLYTPRHGHRVAELGDLQDGCQYVAAGFEKFKKLDYSHHGRKQLRGMRNRQGLQLPPAAPWKPKAPGRWQQCRPPCTIQNTRLQWDTLLALVTKKIHSGAVHKLCRLDGTQVSAGEELLNGHHYVAVGKEEYKQLPYLELLVPQGSACRMLRKAEMSQKTVAVVRSSQRDLTVRDSLQETKASESSASATPQPKAKLFDELNDEF